MTAADAVISVRGLSVRYGRAQVLADVDLDVARGRIMALVGPSGCGKTTFLSCLNRLTDLIPGAAVTGAVRVLGVDVRDARTDVVALRRKVGMIFQRANPFPLSIRENVALALREHAVVGRGELNARVERALDEVGLLAELGGRLDEPATSLSGGQQQRLCLARALTLEPEVVLLDEPCSALDPLSSGVVEDLIGGLRGRYTVVIVTHNLAQARRLADDVALFWVFERVGKLVEVGPTRQIFEAPAEPITAAYVTGARG